MGTAELSCVSLKALCDDPRFQVLGAVTQPDRPKGRDLRLQPSPVKVLALERGLPVWQPQRAREEAFLATLRELNPELIVVVAYGQILPQAILDLPRYGCINVHTSLLPKYRGAAPIQRAILNGESETGVSIMKMDAGLDTGDIITQGSTPILANDNSQTLHDRLAQIGAALLTDTIPKFVGGEITPHPQPEGATYAAKLTKEEGLIHWSQPASTIWNQVRAFVPWPGAYTYLAGEKPVLLKIWQADVTAGHGEPGVVLAAGKSGIAIACGDRALNVLALQREGGRRLSAAEFIAGTPLPVGLKFTGEAGRQQRS